MQELLTPQAAEVPVAEQVARLASAEGAPGTFLPELLKTQCRISDATAGALLRIDERAGVVRVLRVEPPLQRGTIAPVWLARARELVQSVTQTQVDPIEVDGVDDPITSPHLVMVPVQGRGGRRMVAAFLIDASSDAAIQRAQERLEVVSGLIRLQEVRLKLQSRDQVIERLHTAMMVLEAVNEHERFHAAAMSLCNELAAHFGAERVSLGFLDGRYVKTAAISNTERFDRKMKLVQDLESAMEECLDQDTEVIYPRPDNAIFVTRRAEHLSRRHGPVSMASLPLRREGKVVGVLTIERRIEDPPGPDDVELLRLTTELVTPRLMELRRYDRWIGARVLTATRESLAHLIGPRHTGKKVIVFAVMAFLAFIFLGKGEDLVDASFEIAAIDQRVVPVPFDGLLQTVNVEPGDRAVAGKTVLAYLETADLQMKLVAAQAEEAGFLREADLAMRDGKAVEVQIAEANLRRVGAEIKLLEHQIAQATITAPIDGTVVVGDLKRRVGAPVETGDILFEIALLSRLRAELHIPEERIADLLDTDSDWAGHLASVAHPGDYIEFKIQSINPVAEVLEQKNVFRVKARLMEGRSWLRPGMKGVAKVRVGRRCYAYLWTRKITNWVRMKLWI